MLLGASDQNDTVADAGITTVVDNDHTVGIASREYRSMHVSEHRRLGGKRDDDHRKHQAIRSHQVDGPVHDLTMWPWRRYLAFGS